MDRRLGRIVTLPIAIAVICGIAIIPGYLNVQLASSLRLETELPVPAAYEAFTSDGRLREPQLAVALCSIVSDLFRPTLQDAA
jgi:hypothetical protein